MGSDEPYDTEISTEPPSRCTPTRKDYVERFKSIYCPDATVDQWHNWRWQLKNRLVSFDQLNKVFILSEEEKLAFESNINLPFAITPYYASLIDPYNSLDPLRRCMVPVIYETYKSEGEEEDPLHEGEQSVTPTLIHRYPDRVLFLTTKLCSSYCRYCTRSRIVGNCAGNTNRFIEWSKNIEYIKNHPEVRDVILSGGDPLMLPDVDLSWLLKRLKDIDHIEIIRIGTKMPMVLPYRVTSSLLNMLKEYHPIYMSIHCTHPDELTEDVSKALNKIADAGIPTGSQTVLLSGINDDLIVIKKLFHGLLKNRCKPYYLYACDRIVGSGHFAAPIYKGLDIIKGLRGYTSGYAIPTFVIDAPGGGGKVHVIEDNIEGKSESSYLIRNYEGNVYQYHQ